MQSVVITGASTGIGWATAKLLLDRGFRVFCSVRKQADADRLGSEFGANFTPLLFDVTDEAKVLAAAREVRAALGGKTLAGLVNNAGIAVAGPVLELAADNSAARWMSTSSQARIAVGLRAAARIRSVAEGRRAGS
jgi:NAD(P)-dependent dehydrogenase (short-subunit alcohol dehydrogenase family)